MIELLLKTVCSFLHTKHIVTNWDSAVELGIYPREMKTYVHTKTCT